MKTSTSTWTDSEEGEGARTVPSPRLPEHAYRATDLERRQSHRYLTAVAVLAVGLVVGTNLLSLGLDQLRTSVMNANWEFSWSHDADTVLLAIGVYASLVGARAPGPHRRLWAGTTAILALFVIDEVSALHGQLGNLDKLLYAPVLAVLVVCVWRLTAETHERALVRWGLGTLVFAFGMHVAGLHLLRPIGYTTYVYQAGVGFKEGTELAGFVLLVTGLWRRAHFERARWAL